MKTTMPLRAAATLLAVTLAATLAAQNDTTTASPSLVSKPTPSALPDPATQVSHRDRAFLEQAARAGMKEVTVSQAVMNRLANPQVREFAATMIRDHTAADRELRRLALGKGVALEDWDARQVAKLDKTWSGKTGDLDRKYLDEMVGDHEDAVKLFTKAAASDDPAIAAFAENLLPTLRHHLAMAQDLASRGRPGAAAKSRVNVLCHR